MSDITAKNRGLAPGSRQTERGSGTPPTSSTSVRGAARNAIHTYNPDSIKENKEYGGTLYRFPNSKKFTYVSPPNVQAPGTSGGHVSTAQQIPAGAEEAGRWHTHGKTQNYTDEDFSKEDLELARARGLPTWLGTPKGAVKVAVPVKSGIMILDVEPAEGTRPNIRSVKP